MKRETSTLSPVLRDAWDGRDRLATLTVSAVRSTEPHISLVLHSTAEELLVTLPPGSLVNGFLNRFLLAETFIVRALPFAGDPNKMYPPRLIKVLRANLEHARKVERICMSDKTKEV